MPRNFYEILNVSPDIDESGLKFAFRAFARKNHPDRVGKAGESVFIEVRDAFEALKDPVVRFAYDRYVGCQIDIERRIIDFFPWRGIDSVQRF